jgi:transposase
MRRSPPVSSVSPPVVGTAAPAGVRVTLGVDTHRDVHVAVALDPLGRPLGTRAVPTTPGGYAALAAWAHGLGELERVGIEGANSYGAGLTRWLRARGVPVLEVAHPARRVRDRRGKSDPVDAEAAARAVLAGEAVGLPKAADGPVEMLRTLRLARQSALKARTQAANQLHALVVTAPEPLRTRLRGLSLARLVATAAAFRVEAAPATPLATAKLTLRLLAQRHRHLSRELAALEAQLARLVAAAAPALAAVPGVGPDIASALLVAAGDNPERLRSEAAFAHLCGVAPIPASSGRTQRHRLNHGGNRDANRALHMLIVGRLHRDPRTRAYVQRRTGEGKTKKEIVRCLKRYAARELYRLVATAVDRGSMSPLPTLPSGPERSLRSGADSSQPAAPRRDERPVARPRPDVSAFPSRPWPTTSEAPDALDTA